MKKFLFFIISFFVFTACGSDDLGTTRAYVEGKISTSGFSEVNISITSAGKIVAQTIPTSKGSFVLSGPLFSGDFTVNFTKKIESFATTKTNCTLSKDSLSIIVPQPISYIIFDDIKLKK